MNPLLKRLIGVAAAAVLLSGALATPGTPASAAPAPVVATFDVVGEVFRVTFTRPVDIAKAYTFFNGIREQNEHPLGTIIYGDPDVNVGYSWHLNPVRWVNVSTEVCDGRPSYVERHLITSPNYCPWSAVLIDVRRVRP